MRGKPIIVGIVSFGVRQCDLPEIPVVFTRTSRYIGWLKKTPAVFFTREKVFGDPAKNCRKGQFVDVFSKKIRFCRDCPENEVSSGGSNKKCRKCPNGKFRSTSDGTKCTCVGRLARGRGLTKKGFCGQCKPGFFSGTTDRICRLCAAGSFSSTQGSFSCTLCPLSTFSDKKGSTACKRCPSGTFSLPGATQCFQLLT